LLERDLEVSGKIEKIPASGSQQHAIAFSSISDNILIQIEGAQFL
jgi:hypothetical protein